MTSSSSSQAQVVPRPPGHVRCKNYGCQKTYDPSKVDQTDCIHHKSPPVFHETAKYWACCVDKKAYEWDDFMKIPGCQRGHCSDVAKDKKFLGGQDVREACAPKRLDDDVPVDPRKKLDKLREGLVSIGVSPDAFDKAWGRLAAKQGDLSLVVNRMNMLFTEALTSLEDVNLPD
ncbi:unnamed protein product [Polarella glacialis]|uniref:CHORD domain-containing protein n=1 Tax=Polarella glacialis TaxID=89957 RepID=A0A813I9T4_POLGL|nr:unnamed protein product [Polarella glacialis]